MSNRTRKPSPELSAFASQLVARLGIAEAARVMGRSRLTVLSLAQGGDLYQATLDKCEARRMALTQRQAV
jgi:hypothetical protein